MVHVCTYSAVLMQRFKLVQAGTPPPPLQSLKKDLQDLTPIYTTVVYPGQAMCSPPKMNNVFRALLGPLTLVG